MPSNYDLASSAAQYGSVEDNDIACTNGKPTNENGDATPLAETPEVETKDEKAAPQPMVGMGEVFRFANCADRLLIVIGILASCTSGAAMPLMIIVFGGMTDSFIDNGKVEDFWKEYGANLTAQNITLEDIIAHPEILRKFLCGNSTDCPAFDNLMSGLMNDMIDQMSQYTIYYIILGSVVLVIAYIQSTCWTLAAYRQGQRIRTSLFHAILRQEIGWFDTHEIGELNTRLSDDVSKIQEGLGEKFGLFFQQFCSFLAGFTVGFVYGWQLTLVIVAVSPLLAISGAFMAKLGASFTSKELTAYAKAGAVAEEVLGAIRTVTAFGGQDKECKRYNENLYEARRFGIRKGTIAGSGMAVLFVVMFGSYALAFWYGSKLVREGDYTGGDVIIVFFSVLIGAFSVGNAAPNFQYFSTARGAAHKIYQIIDAEPSIDSSSDEGSKLQKLTGNMEFRNVHFRYPSRPDVKVLQGLNLSVSVGQTVALVGSSGCGKSTTIQLMQRFYDPLEGQVLLDGVDLRQLNVQWLRQNIGVVSQEPVLFGTTIAENIRYGRDNVSDEEIEKAARMANAHDFISTLPQKYETLVGERGAQLSGGQKQRVAIARALIRDPKILLLDEATSALDTESEATVQSALDKARQGRTTLVVAHRLSTIKTADVIVALKDGVVEEEGTHEELMQLGGIYYQLVTNQTNMDAMGEADEEDIDITEPEKGVKRAISLQRSFSDSGKFGRMTSVDSNQAAGVGKEGDDEEEEEVPEAALGRIMKLNAPEWYLIVLGCLAALVSGGVQPAFAVIFSEIIGVFSESDMEKQKSDSEFWSGMFAVIGISAATAMFLQSLLFSISGENLTMRLRRAMFESLMRQEIAYFDDRHNSTGALTTRLATEASAVQGATGAKLASSIQAVCSISLGLGIGFYYSWKLALFILAFAPFILISGFVQMKVMLGSVKKDKKALEEAGKVAVEAIENMRTVAQLTKEKLFEKHYVEKTEVPYKKNLRRVHVQGIAFGFSQGLIFYAYGFCFRFGAYLIENDGLEYVNMFKVISAIIFSAMSVGQASSFAPDYGKAKLSAAKIFALLDRTPAIDSSDIGGEMPTNVEGNITFDDVKFRYPTRPDVRVLRGLDINVSRGQTLALVGSSGCGKSTCISLLERFYDPQEGAVKIDSQNISKLNIQWLRAQLGLVQQEPILFDRSIRDNIAYGDNRRDVPMSEIIEAAKNANIHDFISNLPKGYDTNVGDKGTQLSGGQKQRVAIARALVRNPTILLLDEATSALDTESEKVVQEALDRARSGRTCIVIAHRLSTIQDADVIAVVHKGRIVEQGTHSELMSQRGFYHKLNTTQTKRPTS